MAKTNFQSIDEYIAACPPESHAYLREIRKLLQNLATDAKEKISYQRRLLLDLCANAVISYKLDCCKSSPAVCQDTCDKLRCGTPQARR